MNGLRIIYRARFRLFLLLLVIAGCSKKTGSVETPAPVESVHVVKKGENLESILDRSELAEHRPAIISALQRSGFPFRKCLPGDTLRVIKNAAGSWDLTYWQNLRNVYHLRSDSACLAVYMKYPYFDTVQTYVQGKINSTLYESILACGETSSLVIRFADIFAWEIDFFTDTQHDDSFFVYVSKIYCDSVFFDYGMITMASYSGKVGEFCGFYFCDPEGNEDYYNSKGQSLRKSLLKSPLRFSYISSHFSKKRYHPILKIWRPHHGLDYVAPVGTPISSIGNGRVTFKGWKGGYGNLVEIRHNNNFKSRYGHLSRFAKDLYVGKKVKGGDLIGYLGSTGLSTGPHLHFELHKDGVPINPLKVNIPRAPSVKEKYREMFAEYCDSLLQSIEQDFAGRGEALPET